MKMVVKSILQKIYKSNPGNFSFIADKIGFSQE